MSVPAKEAEGTLKSILSPAVSNTTNSNATATASGATAASTATASAPMAANHSNTIPYDPTKDTKTKTDCPTPKATTVTDAEFAHYLNSAEFKKTLEDIQADIEKRPLDHKQLAEYLGLKSCLLTPKEAAKIQTIYEVILKEKSETVFNKNSLIWVAFEIDRIARALSVDHFCQNKLSGPMDVSKIFQPSTKPPVKEVEPKCLQHPIIKFAIAAYLQNYCLPKDSKNGAAKVEFYLSLGIKTLIIGFLANCFDFETLGVFDKNNVLFQLLHRLTYENCVSKFDFTVANKEVARPNPRAVSATALVPNAANPEPVVRQARNGGSHYHVTVGNSHHFTFRPRSGHGPRPNNHNAILNAFSAAQRQAQHNVTNEHRNEDEDIRAAIQRSLQDM